MKQFCMKIDLISHGRENVLFFALKHGGNDVTRKCSFHTAAVKTYAKFQIANNSESEDREV